MPAAFITVTELGDLLGRDLSADAAGTAVVEAACDICRDVAEQTFTAGTTTGTFDGTGTDALLLPELPVSSAGTVEIRDSDGTWNAAGSADFSLNDNGVLLATDTVGTSLFGSAWPKGRQNIRVTYVHGYATADMPESVKAVAKSVASRLILQGPAISEVIGENSVRYAAESTALMPTERLILTKYRRRR